MHRKTMFHIKIDFDKSHDSYLFDKNRNEFFLDYFGLYSTLPLGYSHPVFESDEYIEEMRRISSVKIPNGEIISDEADELVEEFSSHPSMKPFEYFHFCCTGALSIESAIKVAIDEKPTLQPVVMSLQGSFHGINGYGGFVTDRFHPVSARLDGFPEMGWPKLTNPGLVYSDDGSVDEAATQAKVEKFKKEFSETLEKFGKDRVVALLVEPIQSTSGDVYFPQSFFDFIRKACDENNICLIFDEVQTGFGSSGKMWYFEHVGIIPDIVVFGKKTQVSGIMVMKKYESLFKRPIRLEVTWDGNLVDIVRCKYILRAYNQYSILDNANARSAEILAGLRKIDIIKNARATGILMAFDFENTAIRNAFFDAMFERRMLCNKTKDTTIRLRPNLNLSADEVTAGLEILTEAGQTAGYSHAA